MNTVPIWENTKRVEYLGVEHFEVDSAVQSMKLVTRKASERVLRFAYSTYRRLAQQGVGSPLVTIKRWYILCSHVPWPSGHTKQHQGALVDEYTTTLATGC